MTTTPKKCLPIKIVAALVAMLGLALLVAPPASADDRGYPVGGYEMVPVQTITQVVTKAFGTKIQVSFHLGQPAVPTVTATPGWGSATSVTGSGYAKNDWTITLDDLSPQTSYSISITAAKVHEPGTVTYTAPAKVATLTRKIVFKIVYVNIQNDSDPMGCGELEFDGDFASGYEWAGDACDGQIIHPGSVYTRDEVTDSMTRIVSIRDDDTNSYEKAQWPVTLNSEPMNGVESYTKDVNFWLWPAGSGSDMQAHVHATLTVSYHA